MKHIKLFEELKSDTYNVGDYVIVNKYNEELYGKIIEIDEEKLKNASDTYVPAAFAIFFLDKKKRKIYPWFRKEEIIRKLKDNEIPEEWKFIEDTNKYNL